MDNISLNELKPILFKYSDIFTFYVHETYNGFHVFVMSHAILHSISHDPFFLTNHNFSHDSIFLNDHIFFPECRVFRRHNFFDDYIFLTSDTGPQKSIFSDKKQSVFENCIGHTSLKFFEDLNFFAQYISCLFVPVSVRSMSTNKHSGYRCWAKNKHRTQCGFAAITSSKDDQTTRIDPLSDLCQVHRDLAAHDVDSIAWFHKPSYFWPKPQDHLKVTPTKPLADPAEVGSIDDLQQYERDEIAAINDIDRTSLSDQYSQADYVPTPDVTPVPKSRSHDKITSGPAPSNPNKINDPPASPKLEYFTEDQLQQIMPPDIERMFRNPCNQICVNYINHRCKRENTCTRIHLRATAESSATQGHNGAKLCPEFMFNGHCRKSKCTMIRTNALSVEIAAANGNRDLCSLRPIENLLAGTLRTGKYGFLPEESQPDRSRFRLTDKDHQVKRIRRSRSPRRRSNRSRSPRRRSNRFDHKAQSSTTVNIRRNHGSVNINQQAVVPYTPTKKLKDMLDTPKTKNLLDQPLDTIPSRRATRPRDVQQDHATCNKTTRGIELRSAYRVFVESNDGHEVLKRIMQKAKRQD